MKIPRPSFPVIGVLLLIAASVALAVKPSEPVFQTGSPRKGKAEDCIARSQCVGKGLINECSKFTLDNAQEQAVERLGECIAEMKKECDKIGGAFEAPPNGPFEFIEEPNAAKGTAVTITRSYSCNACGKR